MRKIDIIGPTGDVLQFLSATEPSKGSSVMGDPALSYGLDDTALNLVSEFNMGWTRENKNPIALALGVSRRVAESQRSRWQ